MDRPKGVYRAHINFCGTLSGLLFFFSGLKSPFWASKTMFFFLQTSQTSSQFRAATSARRLHGFPKRRLRRLYEIFCFKARRRRNFLKNDVCRTSAIFLEKDVCRTSASFEKRRLHDVCKKKNIAQKPQFWNIWQKGIFWPKSASTSP